MTIRTLLAQLDPTSIFRGRLAGARSRGSIIHEKGHPTRGAHNTRGALRHACFLHLVCRFAVIRCIQAFALFLLEELRVPIDVIAGTSMGSSVGAAVMVRPLPRSRDSLCCHRHTIVGNVLTSSILRSNIRSKTRRRRNTYTGGKRDDTSNQRPHCAAWPQRNSYRCHSGSRRGMAGVGVTCAGASDQGCAAIRSRGARLASAHRQERSRTHPIRSRTSRTGCSSAIRICTPATRPTPA